MCHLSGLGSFQVAGPQAAIHDDRSGDIHPSDRLAQRQGKETSMTISRHTGLLACSALAIACQFTQPAAAQDADAAKTATPIKHLVVIFQENVSFDHYFGTYPKAANPAGEPAFTAAANTPSDIDTLEHASLLTSNPNKSNSANGADAAAPFRLDRTQAATADQGHGYTAEQAAYDNGKMDLFPANTGKGTKDAAGAFGTKGQVMGYYDGNTVTALWNYAQHFAMSDKSFSTTFGPSTPGAINLVSGQTNGMELPAGYKLEADGSYDKGRVVPDGNGNWTMISDLDPTNDVCSNPKYPTALMTGKNIGDMLNDAKMTWGFFEGGFDLTAKNADGSTGCKRSTTSSVTNVAVTDYIPHHQPFQYYKSTANWDHKRPSSVEAIGTSNDGGANHQYDMTDFDAALKAGNLPQVSFLKAPAYQDGHAGYSDPIDEQTFLVNQINELQDSKFWKDTAIVVLYDDSDGWYDHVMAKTVSPSNIGIKGYDVLNGDKCGDGASLPGIDGKPVQGRCGYGTRQPLLVISPYAKSNVVDHTLTDQSSVLRFIEDNWLDGKKIGQGSLDERAGTLDGMFDWTKATNTKLILDPQTGEAKG
jgi:phospholipase C